MANEPPELLAHPSDKYCAAALVCLTLAIFFLSVLVFTFNPLTPAGILVTGIGVLLMIGCIFFFLRYRHALKQEEQV